MWQVSSRSGVATLRTAIHLLLTGGAVSECTVGAEESRIAGQGHRPAEEDG